MWRCWYRILESRCLARPQPTVLQLFLGYSVEIYKSIRAQLRSPQLLLTLLHWLCQLRSKCFTCAMPAWCPKSHPWLHPPDAAFGLYLTGTLLRFLSLQWWQNLYQMMPFSCTLWQTVTLVPKNLTSLALTQRAHASGANCTCTQTIHSEWWDKDIKAMTKRYHSSLS